MENIEETLNMTEKVILAKTGKSLSFLQKVILRDTLTETKKAYSQIARENNYSENYIQQSVAPRLWHLISSLVGEKVNRTNCRVLLEQKLLSLQVAKNSYSIQNLDYPEGQVPLASSLFIERETDALCYQEILQPGALLRLKAPRKMGKTSLLTRILAWCQTHDYRVVHLSLAQAETEILSTVEKFMRWFCANVSEQLGLVSQLEDYWHEDTGNLINSTAYFQKYILQKISKPIVLALDEVNQLYEYPSLARDFFALMRSWHEEAKNTLAWQKLRLILVNSTEVYIPIATNRSPFNVGLSIELHPFTKTQVEELVQRHQLELSWDELERLIILTGGLPYLVRMLLYYSQKHQISLTDLMKQETIEPKLFSKHLHEQLWYLQQEPTLCQAFEQVIGSHTPLMLETQVAFKLKSLGLVHLEGRHAIVSCGLYRSYFSTYFKQDKLIKHLSR